MTRIRSLSEQSGDSDDKESGFNPEKVNKSQSDLGGNDAIAMTCLDDSIMQLAG